MRHLLSAVSLVGAVAAQTPHLFELVPHTRDAFPACSRISSRAMLGVNQGELLVHVPVSHFAGVGQDNTSCTVVGAQLMTQDEDRTTREAFFVVVRGEATGGGPDCAAAPLLREGPFLTPAATGTGPIAFDLTVTFATPVTLPCCVSFYMGIEVATAPTWPADGQSLWISQYRGISTGALDADFSDTPCIGSLNVGWHCMNGQAAQDTARTYWFGLLTDMPVLNMGNIDPTLPPSHCLNSGTRGGTSFGVGGMFPCCATGRMDGLAARVRESDNDFLALFVSDQAICPGPTFPAFDGQLLLSGSLLFVNFAAISRTVGETVIPLLSPNSPSCSAFVGIDVPWQAVTFSLAFTNWRFTNRASVRYL
jgi:hypothetical protein